LIPNQNLKEVPMRYAVQAPGAVVMIRPHALNPTPRRKLTTRFKKPARPQTGQMETIERSARLLPLHIPTIDLAGGSVRCMLAGVHLSARVPQGS
jgi:hypothetical protein